jgi:hypothetical protein
VIQNQATELRGLARQTPTAGQNVVPLRQVKGQSQSWAPVPAWERQPLHDNWRPV